MKVIKIYHFKEIFMTIIEYVIASVFVLIGLVLVLRVLWCVEQYFSFKRREKDVELWHDDDHDLPGGGYRG